MLLFSASLHSDVGEELLGRKREGGERDIGEKV